MDALRLLPAARSQQQGIERLAEQISSGKRISRPSDDPIGMARSLDLKASISTRGAFMNNAAVGLERLSAQDQALGRATDAVIRAREIATQAGNGTLREQDFKALALEVRSAYGELKAAANTKTAQAGYIFAGYRGETEPFPQANGPAQYAGDQGARLLMIGDKDPVQVESHGAEVFQPGTALDMFDALSTLAAQLEAGQPPANLQGTLERLDNGIDHLSGSRAAVGARMNRMEAALEFSGQLQLNDQGALARVENTDMAEAATRFSQLQTQMQATYQAIASMSQSRKTVLNMLG